MSDDAAELEALRAEAIALRQRIAQLEANQILSLTGEHAWTRGFLEHIPMGLVVVELSGAVRFANSEAQRLLGLNYDQLTSRYVSDFQGATLREDGQAMDAAEYPVSKCLTTGKPQAPTIVGVQHPDDAVHWALFSAMPIYGDDEHAHEGALVSFVDVTAMQRERLAQRASEAELQRTQRLESIGKLAAGVAHDFNNMLQVISGMATMLRDHELGQPERERAIAAILRACGRGHGLIENLLGFARLGDIERKPVALDEVVEDVLSLFRGTLPDGVRLEADLHGALPEVYGDRNQLSTVLMNLCLNAVQAIATSAQGTIIVRTDVLDHHDQLDGGAVHLTVLDDGVGIEDEVLERVFEPFFTTKPFGEGTGLGLSMVYGTIHKHGGEIAIRSEPGKGTQVDIHLPTLD